MLESEKFLLFVASYLSALKPEGVSALMIVQPAMKKARELGFNFGSEQFAPDPESLAWEYVNFVYGWASRPKWL